MTPLADALTVGGAAGTILGAAVGWLIPGRGLQRVEENVLRCAGLGAIAGTVVGLGAWASGA